MIPFAALIAFSQNLKLRTRGGAQSDTESKVS
jgi:hypothetical protein